MKVSIKKKKAFTLVELLVVIAILAILASVSIVGYLGFTNKAKLSNDTTVTAQINTALLADEALNGKAKTLSQANKVMEENGIIFEDLRATSKDYRYAWDSVNNKVVLLNDEKEIVAPEDYSTTKLSNLFVVVDSFEEKETLPEFSHFLSSDYVNKKWNYNNTKIVDSSTYAATNGVDLGNNKTVTGIEYTDTETEDVIFNTNEYCGSLKIDNANAVVKHYGQLNTVNIENVKSDSYHEFGKVKQVVNLIKGHFVAEIGSEINSVDIKNSEVSIDFKSNSEETLFMYSNGVTSSQVAIPEKTKATINKANNDIAYIYDTNKTYNDITLAINDLAVNGGKLLVLGKPGVLLQKFNSKTGELTNKIGEQDSICIKKNAVIDLNNYELSLNGDKYGFYLNNPKVELTIKNGNIVTGKSSVISTSETSNSVINLENLNISSNVDANISVNIYGFSTLNIDKNSTIDTKNKNLCAIFIKGEPTLNIYGSIISNGGFAITSNGTNSNNNSIINIYEGSKVIANVHKDNYSLDGAAIYLPTKGVLNVYGGYIEGPTALAIKSGKVNVYGGWIKGTGDFKPFLHNGSGWNSNGDAISIDACNYPAGDPTIINVTNNAKLEVADAKAKLYGYYHKDIETPNVNFTGKQPIEELYK